MTFRNLSPQTMFERLGHTHRPVCHFTGETRDDWVAWKKATLPKVIATLGDFPPRVPLNPELIVEWRQNGLRKQRWLIDVQPELSATLVINSPDDIQDGEHRPAILCWPGHGRYGKEPVMGNDSTTDLRDHIKSHNYNYGEQMAQHGYVTYSLDWIGVGERNDTYKPNWRSHEPTADWCNLFYLHTTMLGTTTLALNISHGMAATDFVCGLPHVDPTRLGVMGLSGGGTMTVWSALCDDRFRAAEIICYSDLWSLAGLRDLNYCGMQVAPGLFKLVDIPDLHGLLAPRPLLEDIGVYDPCFLVDGAMACYEQVRRIYTAAGAADELELDLFAGEHGWGANKSEAFFRQHVWRCRHED